MVASSLIAQHGPAHFNQILQAPGFAQDLPVAAANAKVMSVMAEQLGQPPAFAKKHPTKFSEETKVWPVLLSRHMLRRDLLDAGTHSVSVVSAESCEESRGSRRLDLPAVWGAHFEQRAAHL